MGQRASEQLTVQLCQLDDLTLNKAMATTAREDIYYFNMFPRQVFIDITGKDLH